MTNLECNFMNLEEWKLQQVQEEAVVSQIYHKLSISNSISQHQGALEGGREDAKSAARSKAVYAARAGG